MVRLGVSDRAVAARVVDPRESRVQHIDVRDREVVDGQIDILIETCDRSVGDADILPSADDPGRKPAGSLVFSGGRKLLYYRLLMSPDRRSNLLRSESSSAPDF
jgi:hypothetical protein